MGILDEALAKSKEIAAAEVAKKTEAARVTLDQKEQLRDFKIDTSLDLKKLIIRPA